MFQHTAKFSVPAYGTGTIAHGTPTVRFHSSPMLSEHLGKFFNAILSSKQRICEQCKKNLLCESRAAGAVEFRFYLFALRSR